jgi:hypothetical protein
VGKAEAMTCLRKALGAAATLTLLAGLTAGTAGGSIRTCNLAGKMSEVRGSGSAGHIVYRLKLTNRGTAPCRTGDHPRLALLDAHGLTLPTHVIKEGRAGTATIKPGRSVSALLRFSPDVPSVGEPLHARCEPVAHKVRVTLAAHFSVVAPIVPATSVCGHGTIEQKPLH